MNASVMALEISDLPPPETVAGLWHDVAVAAVPTRAHVLGSGLLSDGDPVAARAEVHGVGTQGDAALPRPR